MSETGDDQTAAEILDDDEIDILDFPPDRSVGVDDLLDDDVPAAGDYAPDDLRRRLARELPDVVVPHDDIGLVAPGGVIDLDDPLGPDGTGELVGEVAEADPGFGGAVLSDSAVAGHDTDTWPAEDAALHLVDEEAGDDRLPYEADTPEQDGIVLDEDEPSRW
jgi:hypothetical protein